MPAPFNRRTLTAWITSLVLLFSALAPAMAQAVNSGARDAAWSDICRANQGAAAASHAGSEKQQLHASVHCPFCATHSSVALLLTPAITLSILAGHDHYPVLFYRSPSPLFSWVAAQPRGPPSLS